jgi:putative membrane protein
MGLAAGQPATAQEGKRAQPQKQAPAAQTPLKAGVDRKDEEFIEKAARNGHAEIAAGKLAATRASSEDVRKFAKQMVEHHSHANRELEEIAIKKGVTWPAGPGKAQEKDLKRLHVLSGREFDRRYMHDSGVEDHEDTVKLFRKAQKDVKDPELKAFFDKTLPTVEQHFEMARTLERSVKDRKVLAGAESASAGSSGRGSGKVK